MHHDTTTPLLHGMLVGGASSLWAFADAPSSTLVPILCAAIGSLVPVSANLLKWSRERRDQRITWLTDELKRQYAEADRLRALLQKKEGTA